MLMTRMFSLRFGNLRAQATDAAHDQIDFHAGAGSFVEFLDDFLIHERIEFHDHAAGFPGQRHGRVRVRSFR